MALEYRNAPAGEIWKPWRQSWADLIGRCVCSASRNTDSYRSHRQAAQRRDAFVIVVILMGDCPYYSIIPYYSLLFPLYSLYS